MKKIGALVIACFFLIVQTALAHTMNESLIYEDLDPTAANAQQILLLNSLGLLGYNGKDMVLAQDEKLTRKEFASWIAGFFKLEGDNFEELAQAALKEEYVTSLEGDVTYEDMNLTLFHRTLKLEKPQDTLTKAQYIDFIYNHLETDMNGHTLLQMGGFTEGPIGVIEDVIEDDHAVSIIIDGKTYPLAGHPRVSAPTVEAKDWVGKTVEKSYMTTDTGHDHGHSEGQDHDHGAEATTEQPVLQYVQLEKEVSVTNTETEQSITNKNEAEKGTETTPSSTTNKYIIPIIVVIVILLPIILIWTRRSKK